MDTENTVENDIKKITTGHAKSVSDLIDLYEQLHPWKFSEYREKEQRGGLDLLHFDIAFRGQPQQFECLLPSFQRQFAKPSSGTAKTIESKLIAAFREHYAKLPDISPDMPQPNQVETGHDLRCLSLMQHYEIPTRLLDWTLTSGLPSTSRAQVIMIALLNYGSMTESCLHFSVRTIPRLWLLLVVQNNSWTNLSF